MGCELTLMHFGVVAMAMARIIVASGVTVVSDDGFTLELLDVATGAQCLDGSAAGFYHRPGASNSSWLVHFEGGGWCVDQADCERRAQSAIGSSKGWAATGLPSMDGGAHGLMSSDPQVNPFSDWSKAHVNYCDGGSYAGNTTAGSLHYRGAVIVEQTIATLLQMGLSSAERLIVTGCSAGGIAVYLHIDRIRQLVPSHIHVVGAPDSGFFLDHNDWQGKPSYSPHYQHIFEMQNMAGGVNQRCIAAQPAGSEWKCFMAATTLPYIQTPLFIFNSLVDAWQMMAILALPCCAPPYNKVGWCNITACPPAAQSAYADYRNDMVSSLQPAIASPVHGLWTETCCLHGMATWEPTWMESEAVGQTARQTFVAWYAKTEPSWTPPSTWAHTSATGNVSTKVIDCAGTGTDFRCNKQCKPGGSGLCPGS